MNFTEKLYLRQYRNDYGNTQLDSSNSDLTTAGWTPVLLGTGLYIIALFSIIFFTGRKEEPKSKKLERFERLEVEVEKALEKIPKIIELVDFTVKETNSRFRIWMNFWMNRSSEFKRQEKPVNRPKK